jgi:hypothetical protein
MVGIEGDTTEDVRERENGESVDTSSEGSIENAPKLKRVIVCKRRRGVWGIPKNHESILVECERFGGAEKRRGQLKKMIDKNRVDIFYLLETMKRKFSMSELRGLVGNSNFS